MDIFRNEQSLASRFFYSQYPKSTDIIAASRPPFADRKLFVTDTTHLPETTADTPAA